MDQASQLRRGKPARTTAGKKELHGRLARPYHKLGLDARGGDAAACRVLTPALAERVFDVRLRWLGGSERHPPWPVPVLG